MTAEIAVYNKSAIALAADSAVTIANSNGINKIINGAEKLFQLSKKYPVGVMIYGGGSLCSVPWDLIIKSYRMNFKEKSFPTLREYVDNFFCYIETNKSFITQEMKDENIYTFLENTVLHQLMNLIPSDPEIIGIDPTPDSIIEKTIPIYAATLEKLSNTEFYENFNEDDLNSVKKYCEQFAPDIIKKYFYSENVCKDLYDKLGKIIINIFSVILCKNNFKGNFSGIVFVGYGNDEYYPQLISYTLEGFINDKLRKIENKGDAINSGSSGVIPFAQDDEVHSFMQGCSRSVADKIEDSHSRCIPNIIENFKKVLDENLSDEKQCITISDNLNSIIYDVFSQSEKEIKEFIYKNHIARVVSMIEFLPKHDLAYMAESLVNITAFKQKISDTYESVGGDIDVAVISKSDGFIWVKRKHYFKQDLNYHFFKNN